MVPAKAPNQMHLGQSGQCGQYGSKGAGDEGAVVVPESKQRWLSIKVDMMLVASSSKTGSGSSSTSKIVALPQKPVETKQGYSDAPVAKQLKIRTITTFFTRHQTFNWFFISFIKYRFTFGFLTDGKGWLSYWGTCGCALLLALSDVLEGFVHTLHKVGKAEIQYEGFDRLVVSFEEVPIRSCGQYVRYSPELSSDDLSQDWCVRMRFRLDCSSSNGKQDGEDKV
ncbi:hypothetical protein IGI04_042343 [Brassica rapa subsp. trilocularis]|uniref:Uncharacterized protein n=1 Tax=Brassica rapa subsp. trilocularis TaxID=1813537 RepID=A0ABQ7KLE9_BRACM|nr:hypothetical protein IGI04_042343 [Brassica rapa subsp. trilocularis]